LQIVEIGVVSNVFATAIEPDAGGGESFRHRRLSIHNVSQFVRLDHALRVLARRPGQAFIPLERRDSSLLSRFVQLTQ